MTAGVYIEEALLQVLRETDLLQFQNKLCIDLHLRRIDHFDHAKDKDLQAHGIPPPAIRRLRAALADKKKEKKSSSFLSSSRKRDSDSQMRPITMENNENFEPEVVAECIIPKEEIKLMERLGDGTFAVVKRAFWNKPNGEKIDVAVKILRDVSSPLIMEELQAEATNLRRLQHPNLIRLYGIVEEPAMMVLELCPGGSLLERLRDREKPTLLVSQLLEYCKQMCKGMTYLETKHCVHRDLAARNILLSADEKVVKICDFGLMRCLEENERLYVMSPKKKIPFAWCPPEALRHRQFSHSSDVWSMGVAMWEIFTYGEEPWIGYKGIDVLKKVEAGERLAKPQRCSHQIYDLMQLCWKLNPDHRPRINLLRGFLNQAEMPIGVVRDAYDSHENGSLFLNKNDQVILIDNTGVLWYGQCIRSRLFGSFPRSNVFVKSQEERGGVSSNNRTSSSSSNGIPKKTPNITLPIKGSFIHAGHGDISGGGWGTPSTIDEIYLKNPVVGQPLVAVGTMASMVSPSIVPLPISSKKPSTLPLKPMSIHLDSPDAFDQFQNEDVSPSRIQIPGPISSHLIATRPAPSRPSINTNSSNIHPPLPIPSYHPYYDPPSSSQYSFGAPLSSSSSSGLPLHPQMTQSRDHGISSVPRPSGQNRSQSASRAVNNTPPPISASAYTANRGSPSPSISSNGIQRTNGYNQSTYGHSSSYNNSVMDELNNRLSSRQPYLHPSSSSNHINDSMNISWRPSISSSSRETPLLNNSTMNTMKGFSYAHDPINPDPFMISDAIRNLSHKPRLSEVMDTSTMTPISSSSSPSFNPSLISQTLEPSSSSSTLSPQLQSTTLNPSILPIQPTRIPIQSNPSNINQYNQSTVSSRPSTQSNPSQPSLPPTTIKPLTTVTPTQTTVSSSSSSTAPTRSTVSTASSSQSTVSSTSTVIPSQVSSNNRESFVMDEINSFLPPPSALFYGSSNPSSSRSSPISSTIPSNQSSSTTNTTSTVSSSSSSSSSSSTMTTQPISTKAILKPTQAALPSTSALQPIRIHNSSPPSQSINTINNIPSSSNTPSLSSINTSSTISRPNGLANTQMPLFALNSSNFMNSSPIPSFNYQMGYGNDNRSYGGGYGGYNIYGGMYGGVPPPTLIYANPQQMNRESRLPPPIQPIQRSNIHVPENATREDIIRLLDPLSSSSSTTNPSTIPPSSSTTSSSAVPPPSSSRSSSPGRRQAEMDSLYAEAFFTDKSRCDWMVSRYGGRIDLALRELKREYLIDTGIARDRDQAETALIAKEWNLNSAADAILNGVI